LISKQYTIIKDENDFSLMMQKINEWAYVSLDTETTGLNTRKDTVIGFSVCGEPGVSFYCPLYTWDKFNQKLQPTFALKYAQTIFNTLSKKELLTWNGSFDIRMIYSNFNINLTNSIIADGMLLKHTVDEDGPFGLKKVAIELQKVLGLNVEEGANKEQIELKENIKANGGNTTANNYEMFKADLDVLGIYAAADADLTLRICEYYLKKLEIEGLESFFFDDEVMPLYKEVTIPMEMAGVRLDLDLIKKLQSEIEIDILKLEGEIITSLMSLDGVKEWFYDTVEEYSDSKLSGSYFQEYCKYMGLIGLKKSEKTGKFLVPKGMELPNSDPKVIHQIKTNLYLSKEGKEVNIFSKKQMGEIAFNYLGYEPLSETEKGTPQFNEEFLESIASEAPWAKMLLDYNKLIKIKGSYIDRYLEGQENGRYYFSYKQHGTISGRYGSDAQQLPRPQEEGSPLVLKYSNQIRKFFIAEQGRIFIDCDYESLEPHTFAHVSGDPGLRDIFISGKDFYSKIAIDTEGLDEYSADKKDPNYLGKVNKNKRQLAKVYALGIPYGMGGYALGKNLNIPTYEAEQLVDGYLSAYPYLKKWMDESKRKAQYEGYVKSEVGRIRHLPKVKEIYSRYGDKILDIKFRNKLSNKIPKEYVLSMYLDYKNGINNARNFQIQSMAASIVNRAAIRINKILKNKNIDGRVCAQIHDQLIFDIPEQSAEECLKIVKDVMENNIKLSVDLKAPPQVARNWYEGH
jgi:DNA polymerase I-like protein with 3'-5' exonuclease and polymerase domains